MASERTNVVRLAGLPDVATDLLELGAEVTVGLVVHVGAASSSIELHATVAGVETQPPPSGFGSVTRTVRLAVASRPERAQEEEPARPGERAPLDPGCGCTGLRHKPPCFYAGALVADPEPPCGLCGRVDCRGFCDDPHP